MEDLLLLFIVIFKIPHRIKIKTLLEVLQASRVPVCGNGFLVAFAHGQRDSCNTMQLVDVFETLGGEDCLVADLVVPIKTANALISRLRNTYYPMTLITRRQISH